MMTRRDERGTRVDWSRATWEGARRESLRHWAKLPLERILSAQEEMAEVAEALSGKSPASEGGSPQTTEPDLSVSLQALERELEEIHQEGNFPAPYLAWLEALEAGRWRDDWSKQRAIASLIKKEMQKEGTWSPELSEKKPETEEDHRHTLIVIRYLALAS